MKVPELWEGERVLYWAELPDDPSFRSNGTGEPESVAWVYVAAPEGLFSFGVDASGATIWSSEYYFDEESDMVAQAEQFGLTLLRSGEEIPARD